MRSYLQRAALCVVLLSLSGAGCAQVRVSPADPYSNERCGIPFYLQRPYVTIKKEIPVEGDEGYIVATLDKSVDPPVFRLKNLPIKLRMCLTQYAPCDGEQIEVPFYTVKRLPDIPVATLEARPYREDPQVAADERAARSASGASGDAAAARAAADRAEAAANDAKAAAAKKTGDADKQTDTRALTSASGIAKFDLSVPQKIDAGEYLEVVFLPDLDEKYTIETTAGLGQASMSAAYGPGSTLNQFQISMDNRELGKFVFESLGKFRDLMLKKSGLDTASVADTGTDGQMHSAMIEKMGHRQSVLLKYIYLGYATPGMYPILKKKEYDECSTSCRSTTEDPFLVKAVYPYTRYSYRVRRELSLWAPGVSASRPPRGAVKPSDVLKSGMVLTSDENGTWKVKPGGILWNQNDGSMVDKLTLTPGTGAEKPTDTAELAELGRELKDQVIKKVDAQTGKKITITAVVLE